MGKIKSSRRELAYALLFGTIENLKELWEMTTCLGIENPPTFVALWELQDTEKYNQRSEMWKISRRRKIEKAFNELIDGDGLYCFVPEGMALLISSRYWGDPGEDLTRLNEVKRRLESQLGINFVVGVGRPYGDMRHLTVSYREASQALTYKGVNRDPAVYYFATADLSHFSTEQIVILRQAILNGQMELAQQIMNKIQDQIANVPVVDINQLKIMVLEFITTVMGACMETGRDTGLLLQYGLDWAQHVQLASDQRQLEKVWERVCLEVFDVSTTTNEIKVIERAKKFLAEHFSEELSLVQIARQQFLSPFYFSRLFKQVTGMTVMDYLTGLRLQAARELLVHSDQPVSHIAGAVGYTDPNYFSRVFRRHVGVSPSEYRSRHYF